MCMTFITISSARLCLVWVAILWSSSSMCFIMCNRSWSSSMCCLSCSCKCALFKVCSGRGWVMLETLMVSVCTEISHTVCISGKFGGIQIWRFRLQPGQIWRCWWHYEAAQCACIIIILYEGCEQGIQPGAMLHFDQLIVESSSSH